MFGKYPNNPYIAPMTYDDFLEEVWVGISPEVVSDSFWEKNREYIMTMTHEMFRVYERSTMTINGREIPTIPPRTFSKIMEVAIHNGKKYPIK